MLLYQSTIEKQERTETYVISCNKGELNMAKRKNQKRSNKKYQVNNRRVRANHQYKDTVFRMLYRDKANLLSLYNAVNDRNYTNPEELQIVTLENAIYMGMKNDVSFILGTQLVLYEHQSTPNPNMPLRNLAYVACVYMAYVFGDNLYGRKLIKIPEPSTSTFLSCFFISLL